MLFLFHSMSVRQFLIRYPRIKSSTYLPIAFNSTTRPCLSSIHDIEIEKIARIINDHPFPDVPLHPTLLHHISPSNLSPKFVENILGRLFATNANGVKAFEFLKFVLHYSNSPPSCDAIEKTLHILSRMRYFDKAWEVMEEIASIDPSLLTLKAMNIVLSKVAKFLTYEDTIKAFNKMEKDVLVGRKFGTEEFNVLLCVFCTQRQMKEAKSVFNKLHSRFKPNTKTMNILLLGFKASGDIASVELFYHELVRRGFKPNNVTYNIRIDAYCKRGCFDDGLRLLGEMERSNCSITLETITTLIHGAGIARNVTRAWELFNELPNKKIRVDVGAYNAMISVLVKCRQIESAMNLMNEMEEKCISPDGITYHTLFHGLMKSKGIDHVKDLYLKMVTNHFVLETRTVVMLMKFFCGNRRVDLGLNLWEYMIENGVCPHDHALALLVTSLCSHGRVNKAFECSIQMLNRGRHMGAPVFNTLERFLREAGEREKLRNLDEMIRKLCSVYPPSKGHAIGLSTPIC